MKKFTAFVLLVLVLLMSVFVATAADGTGTAAMARYFPADADMFFAFRTDEAFIDTFDSLVSNVIAKLPAELNIPPVSLKALLDQQLQQGPQGFSFDELYAWLGDNAAFAANNLEVTMDDDFSNNNDAHYTFVVELKDRAAFETFLETRVGSFLTKTSDGGLTVYTSSMGEGAGVIAVDDDAIYISNQSATAMMTREATLNNSETFNRALSALPEATYNMIGYIDLHQIMAMIPVRANDAESMEALSAMGINLETFGPLTFGLTILDETNFVVDFAIDLAGMPDYVQTVTPIDAEFARFIPVDASLVAQGSNLSNSITVQLDQLKKIAQMNDQPDPTAQIQGALGFVGLTIDDLTSWTTGDYAIFMSFDTQAILDAAMSGPNATFQQLPLDFGLVIETTDPVASQKVADALTNFLMQTTANAEGVTINKQSIGDTPATVITVEFPMGPENMIALDIVMGVTDEVFFIATRPAMESMLTGGDSLLDNARYQEASAYFLPNPYSLAYADNEGTVGFFGIFVLALAGPSIGNIFDEISEGLYAPQSGPVAVQGVEQLPLIMDAVLNIFHSSSISATITDDGFGVGRMVLSLSK